MIAKKINLPALRQALRGRRAESGDQLRGFLPEYIGGMILAAFGLRFQDQLCLGCRIRVQEPVEHALRGGFPEL